jgi:hypothetical protein
LKISGRLSRSGFCSHRVGILSRPLPENKPLQNDRHGLQTAVAIAVQYF